MAAGKGNLAVFFTALVFSLGCFGPPEISEDKARELADTALLDFCSAEDVLYSDFGPAEAQTPQDERFKWGYQFLNTTEDPWKKVAVSVSALGEVSVEFDMLPAEPEEEIFP